jgi:hypothetical protein
MLNKIGGLARALYILLSIVAGFVALGTMNVGLILLALGLVAGLAMPRERMVLAGVAMLALPIVGAALGQVPSIGAQLSAVAGNLQMGVTGAFTTALVMMLYEFVMDGLMGLAGGGATGKAATA